MSTLTCLLQKLGSENTVLILETARPPTPSQKNVNDPLWEQGSTPTPDTTKTNTTSQECSVSPPWNVWPLVSPGAYNAQVLCEKVSVQHKIGCIFDQKVLSVKSKNSDVALVVYLVSCSSRIGTTVDPIRVHHANVVPDFVL